MRGDSKTQLKSRPRDLVWRISYKASGREVARGKTRIMFFDYTARKPASVPPAFVARVAA